MLISDSIAAFIDEMLSDCGGTLEIKRNDLAKRLGCVPSQINYVVASRFTPERGYIIESRRGGGGYIRIIRKVMREEDLLMQIFRSVGESLSETEFCSLLDTLYAADLITAREGRYIRACLSQSGLSALPQNAQGQLRASAFRNLIVSMMQ